MVRLETAPTEWDQVNLVLFPIQTVGAISESRPFVSGELEFPLTNSNESFLKLTHKGRACEIQPTDCSYMCCSTTF